MCLINKRGMVMGKLRLGMRKDKDKGRIGGEIMMVRGNLRLVHMWR